MLLAFKKVCDIIFEFQNTKYDGIDFEFICFYSNSYSRGKGFMTIHDILTFLRDGQKVSDHFMMFYYFYFDIQQICSCLFIPSSTIYRTSPTFIIHPQNISATEDECRVIIDNFEPDGPSKQKDQLSEIGNC